MHHINIKIFIYYNSESQKTVFNVLALWLVVANLLFVINVTCFILQSRMSYFLRYHWLIKIREICHVINRVVYQFCHRQCLHALYNCKSTTIKFQDGNNVTGRQTDRQIIITITTFWIINSLKRRSSSSEVFCKIGF